MSRDSYKFRINYKNINLQENQAEEDMRRLREKFERDHQLELEKKEKAEARAKHKELIAQMKETTKKSKENPDTFYNQVEFVGSMNSKLFKTHRDSKEELVVAANKPSRYTYFLLSAPLIQ